MNLYLLVGATITWCVIGIGSWIGWQLLRQNGRLLLRIEALEEQVEQLGLDEVLSSEPNNNGQSRSLARSRINRNGLKAGTLAPDFRLPRVDSGELTLQEFRGRRILL